ncbi:autophagy-related protein 25-like [Cryptomeria japonica]|uniref:autophagy-related protein 25-like n=1 Tax=Cryptomeria japonica TaxID=3369 RepID=UPI0027DA99EE|nr:autophagy-related protein 25-like [Cryptomeria japonica]
MITSLQIELDDSKSVVDNLKSVLVDKDKEIQTLEQQVTSLKKQVEEYERNIHLNDILGKQKQHKDMTGVGFNIGEYSQTSNQNFKVDGKKHYLSINETFSGLMHFSMAIASFAINLDTKQHATARTPQQNGVVERKNKIVKEMARTMLDEAKLPGYSTHSKAYKCFNKRLNKIVEYVNVKFDEKLLLDDDHVQDVEEEPIVDLDRSPKSAKADDTQQEDVSSAKVVTL